MLKEFKEFALRGNVVDMAIGILIGGAFAPIARSLVDDVIMPPIGLVIGNVNFDDLFWVLREGATAAPYASLEVAREAGAVTINYGVFINTILTFLIVAWAAFMVVKGMNRLRRSEEGAAPEEPTTRTCPHCQTTIPIKATRCPACTSELDPAPG
jgi:large conductance mechanosensitive channel